ncbi:MAG: carboxypeptidase-like regulatory domain-containing protein [bacterium]|nr:carboxypeptidase-like regulatory domain-containing protein [bacterium]
MARESRSRFPRRWWPLLLALAVLCGGCKKPEEEKNGVTGHVSSPDSDAAGVTVELYTPPASTTDAWAGSAANPEVGFLYDLPAAWDYRRQATQLQASFTTGADGAFEFPDLADGDYILSARKAGCGWSVPCAANVHGQSVDAGTLTLPEVHTLLANVTADTRWLSGRHYVIQSALAVAAGVTLTIEPGAVVRFAMDARINVMGTLIAEGEPGRFILFTSNESVPDVMDPWYILFTESASPPRFLYCAFRYGEDAIRTRLPGGRIEYCYFGSFGAQGVSLLGNADAEMDSIIFRRNVTNSVPVVLQVINVPAERPMLIERNAIAGSSKYGVDLQTVRTGAVHCNWFYDCGHGGTAGATGALHIFRASDLDVDHNEFRESQFGVDLGSQVDSSVHIHHNYFYLDTTAMYVGYTPDSQGPSFPHFNYNCIQTIKIYHIQLSACLVNTEPLDATNNYWDGYSGTSLQHFLYDREDELRCPYITVGTILPTCNRDEAGLCGM